MNVPTEKPATVNFVLGQTHLTSLVEDIHEVIVGAVPGIRFGLAIREAPGDCPIRPASPEAGGRTDQTV